MLKESYILQKNTLSEGQKTLHQSRIPRGKSWRFVCGKLQGRALNELDGARTNVDDGILLVQQRSRDCVMSCSEFLLFFEKNEGTRNTEG